MQWLTAAPLSRGVRRILDADGEAFRLGRPLSDKVGSAAMRF